MYTKILLKKIIVINILICLQYAYSSDDSSINVISNVRPTNLVINNHNSIVINGTLTLQNGKVVGSASGNIPLRVPRVRTVPLPPEKRYVLSNGRSVDVMPLSIGYKTIHLSRTDTPGVFLTEKGKKKLNRERKGRSLNLLNNYFEEQGLLDVNGFSLAKIELLALNKLNPSNDLNEKSKDWMISRALAKEFNLSVDQMGYVYEKALEKIKSLDSNLDTRKRKIDSNAIADIENPTKKKARTKKQNFAEQVVIIDSTQED